jgi:ribonucleoside-diphosphate reductase alpha chain
MAIQQRRRHHKAPLGQSQIAQAVFSAAEATGISDRPLIEELTNQIIQRLEPAQPLPGMEHLISPQKKPRKDLQVQSMVKEILSQRATPTPKEPPQTPTQLTENARRVLERRYLKKDSQGNPDETPEDLFRRVASNIASAELIYNPEADVRSREEEFYQVMARGEFLPNSPTLMNAGRELQQLSACFVLPIEDSMESIFDAVKYTALIHKSGGGTGFSFSRLRPESDTVGSTGGVASGPVSFMRAFDTATEVIKQGGMRRGANMGILLVHHPDIMKFIEAKEDPRAFTNFNISVAVTDRFMEAVAKGTAYDLINPRTQEVVGQLDARTVFDKIVDMAWRTGDPGIVFLDRINEANPTPHLGDIESTNPCGEQPLLPHESCNLGSINLAQMVLRRNGSAEIDYDKLGRVVATAIRFLDNVIDVNKFPIPQIAEMTRQNRKIGLGVMGFADMLIRLGIPYDSEDGLRVAEEVMGFISQRATETSVGLGRERGVFPAFKGSAYSKGKGPRVRNATRTTIAPTGTLSIIAGCSSGIEPLFALSFVRNILDNEEFVEVNPYFEEVARDQGFYSPELMAELAQGGRLRDMDAVPEEVKMVFVTAHDITPEWHVRMQAAFQKYTDNAVSKTVNFPHDATREDVAQVYMLAYKEGLKGITIYRDRSKDRQVLSTGQAPRELVEGEEELGRMVEGSGILPRNRPKSTQGFTEKVTTGCGKVYVTVNSDEQGICEVFTSLGKAGGCASAQLEATSRLISLALRSGVDTASVMKHLRGIRCPSIAWEDGHAVLSCADAIATVLERYLGVERTENPGLGMTGNPGTALSMTPSQAGQCPDCGGLLVYQEGCHHCLSCGYTKCE